VPRRIGRAGTAPDADEDFTLLLPWVNTEMMNVFLAGMARRLKGRRCVLIMDKAGQHVSRELLVPPNTRIVLLPPCSPGLNPVERPWRWAKLRVRSRKRPKRDTILNRLHLTLESVVDAVDAYMRAATADFFMSVCRCDYL
jgi:transposase